MSRVSGGIASESCAILLAPLIYVNRNLSPIGKRRVFDYTFTNDDCGRLTFDLFFGSDHHAFCLKGVVSVVPPARPPSNISRAEARAGSARP
jgi:hypothetical protein